MAYGEELQVLKKNNFLYNFSHSKKCNSSYNWHWFVNDFNVITDNRASETRWMMQYTKYIIVQVRYILNLTSYDTRRFLSLYVCFDSFDSFEPRISLWNVSKDEIPDFSVNVNSRLSETRSNQNLGIPTRWNMKNRKLKTIWVCMVNSEFVFKVKRSILG